MSRLQELETEGIQAARDAGLRAIQEAQAATGTPGLGPEARRIILELGGDPDQVKPGDVGQVQIHRRGSDRRYEWLETWDDPANFTLQAVRERFGGGDFKAVLGRPEGGALVHLQFKVSGASKTPPSEAADAPGATDAALQREIERLRGLIEGKRESPALEMLQIMVPLMTAITTTMASAQNAALTPLLEALSKRDRPAVDPLELLERAADILERRGNGSGGYESVLHTMAPALIKALAGARELDTVPDRPALLPAPPTHEHQETHGVGMAPPPPWAQLIAPHVPELVRLAAVRADAAYWAEQVSGELSYEQWTFIDDLLTQDDGRTQFFAAFPATIEHRSWFERFFDGLEEQAEEEPPPAAE